MDLAWIGVNSEVLSLSILARQLLPGETIVSTRVINSVTPYRCLLSLAGRFDSFGLVRSRHGGRTSGGSHHFALVPVQSVCSRFQATRRSQRSFEKYQVPDTPGAIFPQHVPLVLLEAHTWFLFLMSSTLLNALLHLAYSLSRCLKPYSGTIHPSASDTRRVNIK